MDLPHPLHAMSRTSACWFFLSWHIHVQRTSAVGQVMSGTGTCVCNQCSIQAASLRLSSPKGSGVSHFGFEQRKSQPDGHGFPVKQCLALVCRPPPPSACATVCPKVQQVSFTLFIQVVATMVRFVLDIWSNQRVISSQWQCLRSIGLSWVCIHCQGTTVQHGVLDRLCKPSSEFARSRFASTWHPGGHVQAGETCRLDFWRLAS